MDVKVFTLKFSPVLQGFDDSALREFVKDKHLDSVDNHFFVQDGTPYLAVVVCYHLASPELPAPALEETKNRDESWREILTDEDWPLFNTLRAWRNDYAREHSTPAYTIANNRQLALAVHARPATLSRVGCAFRRVCAEAFSFRRAREQTRNPAPYLFPSACAP